MQIKIKNISVNKIFLDKVIFHCLHPNIMKSIDLNTHTISGGIGEEDQIVSLFDETTVFNPNEIRQYVFILQHKDASHKINKFEQVRPLNVKVYSTN